jgi:beta-glucosidase
MFIRAEPQLGLPRLKMNDASMGVNTWGPSTAYAASIALPQHGIRFWPDVLVKPSVEMHARAVSTSFLGLQSTSIARH